MSDPHARTSGRVILLGGALAAAPLVVRALTIADWRPGRVFVDFATSWTAGHWVLEHGGPGLWDLERFAAFQRSVLPTLEHPVPFPYPPILAMLVVLPALLPYLWAAVTWLGATAAAMVAGARPRDGHLGRLMLLVAPASVVNALFGQNGFLSAALMAGGLRLLPARPVLAGVVLGGMAYKPQLALVIPVVLVAARQWRTLAAAAASAASLAVVSALALGAEAWREWFMLLPKMRRMYEAFEETALIKVPTLTASLLRLGVTTATAELLQAALAVVTLGVLAASVARRGIGPVQRAMALTAPFLISPYAYVYDLTLVAVAVLWLVEDGAAEGGPALSLSLAAAWLLPPLMLLLPSPVSAPLAPVTLLALFILAARRGEMAHAQRASA